MFATKGFRFPNGDAIPTLFLSGSRLTLSATAVSTAEAALPTGSALVMIRSTVNVWIRFGTTGMGAASAADTSMLFPAGAEIIPIPTPNTHVRVLRAGTDDGSVQIEKVDLATATS